MMHKKTKTRGQRGGRTYGWGKRHRGSGHRGGFGNAGTGKKAHANKPSVWKERYLGAYGFHRRNTNPVIAITLRSVEDLLNKKSRTEGKEVNTIDLGKEGFTKLLGSGTIARKIHVTIPTATASAISKIQKAGGTCTVSEQSNNG